VEQQQHATDLNAREEDIRIMKGQAIESDQFHHVKQTASNSGSLSGLGSSGSGSPGKDSKYRSPKSFKPEVLEALYKFAEGYADPF